jgi:hypothetical protein
MPLTSSLSTEESGSFILVSLSHAESAWNKKGGLQKFKQLQLSIVLVFLSISVSTWILVAKIFHMDIFVLQPFE